MRYSFREFLQLDEGTKTRLGTLELNEDLAGKQKDKLMRELDSKLKSHDYYFTYSDDSRSYKKGQKEQEEIRKLVDLLGDDGMSLYKQYLKKKKLIEDITKPRLNPYETFVQKKMDAWGIKTLDALEPEPYKRFWSEVDDEWGSKDEKQRKEQKSIFPDLNASERNIQLGYAEERPVGGRSKHGFVDAGNLYYNQPMYVPPSKERKKKYE